jgi:HAD superfamily hydrolase (TIGR01459 family)
MLDQMAVPQNVYDAIVTSGDVTRAFLEEYRGRNIHHVGPLTDDPLLAGCEISRTSPEEAAAVLVSGLDEPQHTPAHYKDRLAHWRELDLPLICANPDKVVEVGDEILYCAGALADVYEKLGGKVLTAGKPHVPIYRNAMRALGEVAGEELALDEVLAIGDSVRTDATGAAKHGLDLLFITGSIHAEELGATDDPKLVHDLVAPSVVNMVGFLKHLK